MNMRDTNMLEPNRWLCRNNLLFALLPGMLLTAIAIGSRLGFPPYHDESLYLPVALDFGKALDLRRLFDYTGVRCVAGPAIYLVYGTWLHFLSGTLFTARILSVLLSASAGVFHFAIARRIGVAGPLVALALAFVPHYLLTGQTFLTEPLVVFSSILGVWLWMEGDGRPRAISTWLALVPLALAVNTRVSFLAIPLALCLAGAVLVRKWPAILVPALAVVVQFPFWIAWKGLVPPLEDIAIIPGVEPKAGLHFDTLVHMITILGFCFWPALRRPQWTDLAWLLPGVVFYAICMPDMGRRFAGPLQAFTSILAPWQGRTILVLCFAAGWVLVGQLIRQFFNTARSIPARTLDLVALASLGIYAVSPLAFDRYSLSFSPFWLLALAPVALASQRRKITWACWLVVMAGMALVSVAVLFRWVAIAR